MPDDKKARIAALIPAAGEDAWINETAKAFGPRVKVLRAGGRERADTVLGGLMAANLPGDAWVLVHDAARPCVRPSEVNHLLDEVLGDSSVEGGILAVPMADTVKRTDSRRRILETVPRENLWRPRRSSFARER